MMKSLAKRERALHFYGKWGLIVGAAIGFIGIVVGIVGIAVALLK
jgi:hypothetical protein